MLSGQLILREATAEGTAVRRVVMKVSEFTTRVRQRRGGDARDLCGKNAA